MYFVLQSLLVFCTDLHICVIYCPVPCRDKNTYYSIYETKIFGSSNEYYYVLSFFINAILLRNRLKYEYSIIIYAPLCRSKHVRLLLLLLWNTGWWNTLFYLRKVNDVYQAPQWQKSSIVKLLHIVNDYEGVLKPLESFVWEKDEIQFIIWKAICFFKFAFVQIWYKLYTYYRNVDIYDDGHVTLTSKTGRVVQTVQKCAFFLW